jgi:isopenicillin N synthase-like dioxygenase
MRVIHYPPIESTQEGERAGAHEDINLITLLIGGQQAGLEILSKEEGWLRASVEEDVIICNIGDMLQRFTNNNLKSTTHRVRAVGGEASSSRYSIPYFFHPNPDWYIETLENQIDEDNPNNYPDGILSEDYLQERLKEIKLV